MLKFIRTIFFLMIGVTFIANAVRLDTTNCSMEQENADSMHCDMDMNSEASNDNSHDCCTQSQTENQADSQNQADSCQLICSCFSHASELSSNPILITEIHVSDVILPENLIISAPNLTSEQTFDYRSSFQRIPDNPIFLKVCSFRI